MSASFFARALGRGRCCALLLVVALFMFMASGIGATTLPVPLRPQHAAVWCWAASSEMVFDYLHSDQAATTGQCSLARVVLNECRCRRPDDALASDRNCNKFNPFGDGDFIPKLVSGIRVTPGSEPTPRAIAFDLLRCEIEDRLTPVLFWTRNGDDCNDTPGHIAVAAGVVSSPSGAKFVLVLDPLPKGRNEGGDKYWLSWEGFSCGALGLGQCAAYYNFQGESRRFESCKVESTEETLDCRTAPGKLERIQNISQVESGLNAVFSGEGGLSMLQGLGVADSGSVQCARDVVLRGALPNPDTAESPSFNYQRTRRSRIFCRKGAAQFSVFLDRLPGGDSYIAGFGEPRMTELLLQKTQVLRDVTKDGLFLHGFFASSSPIDVDELFLPGAGEVILREPISDAAVRVGQPLSSIKSFGGLLDEAIEEGGATIRTIIREFYGRKK